MKKEWSSKWKSSTQPRKQRKYRYNAPSHVKRKFLSANLSPTLRERYGKRSIVIRSGDEVLISRGKSKGTKGIVERVDINKERVYIEGVKMKKVDGSDVSKPVTASNCMITKIKIDDKRRQAILERSERAPKKKVEKKVEKKDE